MQIEFECPDFDLEFCIPMSWKSEFLMVIQTDSDFFESDVSNDDGVYSNWYQIDSECPDLDLNSVFRLSLTDYTDGF